MNRTFLKYLGAAAALSVFTGQAQAADELGMFSSRGPDLAFAINSVCVPSLRQGGTIEGLVGRSGVAEDLDGRPAMRLHGFGRVFVAADPGTRGCVIVTHKGDGHTARAEALEALEHSYLLEPLTGPNETVLHSRKWTGLNEAYCFRLDEKVVEVDITTARGQDGEDPGGSDALRMRLYWSDAEALKKGVCRA